MVNSGKVHLQEQQIRCRPFLLETGVGERARIRLYISQRVMLREADLPTVPQPLLQRMQDIKGESPSPVPCPSPRDLGTSTWFLSRLGHETEAQNWAAPLGLPLPEIISHSLPEPKDGRGP